MKIYKLSEKTDLIIHKLYSEEADDCIKGYPCRLSCISRNKNCLSGLPDKTAIIVENFVGLLIKRQSSVQSKSRDALESKLSEVKLDPKQIKALVELGNKYNRGELSEEVMEEAMRVYTDLILKPKSNKGEAKTLSYKSLEHSEKVVAEMKQHYNNSFDGEGNFNPKYPGGVAEFVDKQRIVEVPDDVVDLIFQSLPTTSKSGLSNLGDPKGRFDKAWTGTDAQGNPTWGSPNQTRAKMLIKRYMEQGGIDPYTGEIMSFKDMEPEHTVPMEVGGLKSDDERNILMSSASFNRYKDKLSGEELHERVKKDINNGEGDWESNNAKKVRGAEARSKDIDKGGTELESIMSLPSAKERIAYIDTLERTVGDKALKYIVRNTSLGKSTFPENKPFDSVSNERNGRPAELNIRSKSPVFSPILKAFASLEDKDVLDFQKKLNILMEKRGFTKGERAKLESSYIKGSPEAKRATQNAIAEKDKEFFEGLEKLLSTFGVS